MTRYSPRTGQPTTYQAGPFDSGHLYLQWGGTLPGGEQWSCGMRLAPVTAASSGDPAGMIDGCKTAITAYHSDVASRISSAAKLTFCKLNMINEAGHYASGETYESVFTAVNGGLTPTNPIPNQLALAISLTTAVDRGHAHRGRFYNPLPAMVLGSDGLIQTVDRDAVKTRALTFVNAISAVSTNYDVAVYSRKSGDPRHRLVTGVQVGRVLDTQRRRRRSLTEAY